MPMSSGASFKETHTWYRYLFTLPPQASATSMAVYGDKLHCTTRKVLEFHLRNCGVLLRWSLLYEKLILGFSIRWNQSMIINEESKNERRCFLAQTRSKID